MPWSSASSLVAVVLAAIVAAAVGFVFRGYLARETISMHEANRRAALDRIEELNHNLATQDELLDTSAARNMALELRNRELLDMVTARPELAELRSLLTHLAASLAADHRRILERIQRVHSAAFFANPERDRRKEPRDEDQT